MLDFFVLAGGAPRHYTDVLLVGPTGTGKELVARAIHQISPVSQQKLAVCNCSAMVDTLLESQLFGTYAGRLRGPPTRGRDSSSSRTAERWFWMKWEKLR